jgi:hypothetical protein
MMYERLFVVPSFLQTLAFRVVYAPSYVLEVSSVASYMQCTQEDNSQSLHIVSDIDADV